jgi:small acid-soluble spore protein (thioredoxin-like protein)
MKNDRHDTFNKNSENARSLGKMIENTKENIHEAEISMEFAADPEELENLEEKNARRKTAIDRMNEQIREKKAFQAKKNSFK